LDNVLVTGSKGFIGQNILQELDENSIKYCTFNEDELDTENISQDIENLISDNKPTAILHTGACADTLNIDVNYMMLTNYEFTKKLTLEAKKFQIPLIFSSSAANYGKNGKNPSNLYGWSKYVAEEFVIQNGGLALRYFNVYGPGEEHKKNMASFVFQAHQMKREGKLVQIFPGSPSRDFVHVKDVVNANLYAMRNYHSFKNKYYEVGTGESHTFEESLRFFNIEYSYKKLNDVPLGYQYFTKSNPLKWLPNWCPEFGFEKGMASYAEFLGSSHA